MHGILYPQNEIIEYNMLGNDIVSRLYCNTILTLTDKVVHSLIQTHPIHGEVSDKLSLHSSIVTLHSMILGSSNRISQFI